MPITETDYYFLKGMKALQDEDNKAAIRFFSTVLLIRQSNT